MTDVITAEDIAEANQERLVQLAELTRRIAVGVIAVGALGAVAWCWFVVRTQTELLDRDFDEHLSLARRLDVLAPAVTSLALCALAIGLGAALHLWASNLLAAMGGSLHGVTRTTTRAPSTCR